MTYLDSALALATDGMPDCGYCHNMRFLRSGALFGHPDFGKAVACPQCRVPQKRQAQAVDALSESVPDRSLCLLSNYVPTDNPEALAAVEAWIEVAQHSGASRPGSLPWLTLMGGFGTGKTHLLVAAFYRLRDAEVAALYSVAPRLLETFRKGYDDNTYTQRLDQVRSAPALIVDDLGAESRKPWTDERMFDLFDYRYRMRLPTAIATNLAPGFMEGRISSRLRDQGVARVVAMRGQDWRTRAHTHPTGK